MSAEGKAREKGALTINLLGREFRVGCPEGEEKQLLAAVEDLNRRMKELRDTGKVNGNEQIALMAALNVAHELYAKKPAEAGFDGSAIRRRIQRMQETLDSALAADQENLF